MPLWETDGEPATPTRGVWRNKASASWRNSSHVESGCFNGVQHREDELVCPSYLAGFQPKRKRPEGRKIHHFSYVIGRCRTRAHDHHRGHRACASTRFPSCSCLQYRRPHRAVAVFSDAKIRLSGGKPQSFAVLILQFHGVKRLPVIDIAKKAVFLSYTAGFRVATFRKPPTLPAQSGGGGRHIFQGCQESCQDRRRV